MSSVVPSSSDVHSVGLDVSSFGPNCISRVLSPSHILKLNSLCSLHPTNLDIGVLSCFFHKVSSAFTFKKGKEESYIYLGHSDPSPDTTLPSWVRFAWSFIHLYSH